MTIRSNACLLPIGERSVSDRLAISGVLISSVSVSYALLPDAYHRGLCITDSSLPGAQGVFLKSRGAFENRGGL